MDSEDRARIEECLRAEFATARGAHDSEARALESVAIDLRLSLTDCAVALGREDLLDGLGTSWTIGFPENPPHMS